MKKPHHLILLAAILSVFMGLWLYNMKDGVRLFPADAYPIDCAMNILKHGRIALSVNGGMYDFDKYWFEYPPLLSMATAFMFRIFGVSYEVSKIIPLVCMILTIAVVFAFTSRYTGPKEAGIISALLAFDPIFFSHSLRVRHDCLTILLFSISIMVFFVNSNKKRPALALVSGAAAGLAFLTHFTMIWLMVIFAAFVVSSPRQFKSLSRIYLLHTLAFLAVVSPYLLWIALDQERRGLFLTQVFLNTYTAKHPSMHFSYLKMLLNPLANLYLAFFRDRSFYPFILMAAAAFLIRHYRRYKYLFLAVMIPLAMTTFNFRAAHYLLPTMAVCYSSLAFLFPKDSPKRRLRPGLAVLGILLAVEIFIDIYRIGKHPGMLMNRAYFTKVIAQNTEPNSRIAADINFILCESGGRKIVNISALRYDVWLLHYSYGDAVGFIDPDYIFFTEEDEKSAGSTRIQPSGFARLMQEDFELVKKVEGRPYTDLWIYKKRQGR